MKIHFLIKLFCWVFALSSFASELDPYTLTHITNEHFRDYSFQELKSLIGAHADLLPQYLCDGKKEFELIPNLILSNPNGDSLKVQSGDESDDQILIYKEGSYYTLDGQKARRSNDEFQRLTLENLQKLEMTKNGKILLDRLEHSFYPITIVHGGNRFLAQRPSEGTGRGIYRANIISAFQQRSETTEAILGEIGSGGKLSFDPLGEYARIESDNRSRPVPAVVTLAHEAFHAFDAIRGLMDLRFVTGPTYEFIQVNEYRAVYFENQIRKELGLKYAKFYSNVSRSEAKTAPGQLSNAGEPRLIPAPCIEKLE